MSEFYVRCFRIGKVGKHPNADTLSITQGPSGYPVVFKTGDFQAGQLAVHIPVDALVDVSLPNFSWLADKATNGVFRVRATRLRGVPSYGFLCPATEVMREGDLVQNHPCFRVRKYESEPVYDQGSVIQGEHALIPEAAMIPQYDIEGMRRYGDVIQEGEMVSVTEKIHGSNGRWAHINGKLLCGSRTTFRQNSVWNRMAVRYGLDKKLAKSPGLVLYGEVYGKGIQDLTYGVDDQRVAFFDVYDTATGRWFWPYELDAYLAGECLPGCPELYRGPYTKDLAQMAEGLTVLGNGCHVREGIVVKPLVERFDASIGRVFLKQPGEGYLLRKQQNDVPPIRFTLHHRLPEPGSQTWWNTEQSRLLWQPLSGPDSAVSSASKMEVIPTPDVYDPRSNQTKGSPRR